MPNCIPNGLQRRDESQPDVKLLFDRNKGVLDAHDRVYINKYHYSEPIPPAAVDDGRGR